MIGNRSKKFEAKLNVRQTKYMILSSNHNNENESEIGKKEFKRVKQLSYLGMLEIEDI